MNILNILNICFKYSILISIHKYLTFGVLFTTIPDDMYIIWCICFIFLINIDPLKITIVRAVQISISAALTAFACHQNDICGHLISSASLNAFFECFHPNPYQSCTHSFCLTSIWINDILWHLISSHLPNAFFYVFTKSLPPKIYVLIFRYFQLILPSPISIWMFLSNLKSFDELINSSSSALAFCEFHRNCWILFEVEIY